MKITNIMPGPRGITTINGPILIEARQTVEADITVSEFNVAKATGWFELDGDPVPDAKPTQVSETIRVSVEDADVKKLVEKETAPLIDQLRAKDEELSTATARIVDLEASVAAGASTVDAPLVAKHAGGGSYTVFRGEPIEVLDKLTKEEAEAFNALDTEAKETFVADKKAAA